MIREAASGVSEWVVYHPPKSVSFGHQSRVRNPRRAWPMVEQFLADFTQYELGHDVELRCHGPDAHTDLAVAMQRIREARSLFGPEVNPKQTDPRWKLSQAQLKAAVEFALDDDKFPKQAVGPSWFAFSYRFLWKDFERLPYRVRGNESRDPKSLLGVIFGYKGLFLQPTFKFPAPWNSEYLRDFVARIEPAAPFRFRNQYFKRSLPTRNANSKRGQFLNLSKNWREATIPISGT
jgi:hypothetical protein